ncbi:MAG TPA: hypothetical protein VFT57_15825 [Gemmatimonadaceae bacterium]|nr:hypothetical protein [Gemmatimonadaceae bacterium]
MGEIRSYSMQAGRAVLSREGQRLFGVVHTLYGTVEVDHYTGSDGRAELYMCTAQRGRRYHQQLARDWPWVPRALARRAGMFAQEVVALAEVDNA